MTDDLWFAVAIVAFLVAVVWALNRGPDAHADHDQAEDDFDQAEWDRTAEDAARAEVPADVAEIAELEAIYKIRSRPRNTIPHQTRRTEDNQ